MAVYTDWIKPLTSPYPDSLAGASNRPVYTFDVEAQAQYELLPDTGTLGIGFEEALGMHIALNEQRFTYYSDLDSNDPRRSLGVIYPFPVDSIKSIEVHRDVVLLIPDYGPPPEWTLGSRVPLFHKPRITVVYIGGQGYGASAGIQRACLLWNICARTWGMEIPGRLPTDVPLST